MTIFAKFDADGLPVGFWIAAAYIDPAAVIPPDAIEITPEQHADMLAHPGARRWVDGAVVEYAPPAEPPTLDTCRLAVQAMLDAKAGERQYDSVASAVSYVTSTNPAWQAEALALRDWRDAVWVFVFSALAAVQAEKRVAPSVTGLLAEIEAACPFAWPV